MNKSIFTVAVPPEGERPALAYNTLNGALAELGDSAYQLLASCSPGSSELKRSEGCGASERSFSSEELQAYDSSGMDGPSLAVALDEAGLLAPDGVDEQAQLEARFLEDMNRDDFLSLCIAPTMACNLRCVYCYEDHEACRMTTEVEDAILRFVKRRHAAYRITTLEVLWYGGEPMLEFALVRRLSQRFMDFCEQNGVRYRARITTNATLIDESAARELFDLGVREAMPTLDGLPENHDRRRVGIDGSGSFEATLRGIEALAKAGIEVGVNCNLDFANACDTLELKRRLAANGCSFYTSHLRNYGSWCAGAGEGCDERKHGENPCLMSRAAYARRLFEAYRDGKPRAADVCETLRSKRSFCRGKMSAYFVIDPEGYLCRCDGHMRDERYRLGNVLDADLPLSHPETVAPSVKNPRCKGCSCLPLCWGDCNWEWEMFDENCSAVRYELPRYITLLYDALLAEGLIEPSSGCGVGESKVKLQSEAAPLKVLLAPRDIEAVYAVPFSPFAGDNVM